MEAVKEITVWEGISRQPNHIYLLEGDRVLAYIKWGEGAPEYLSGKIKIDRRGRKFVPADKALFKKVKEESNAITVTGSKGQVYTIDPEAKTCTCPGFQFRGACKHLAEHGSKIN